MQTKINASANYMQTFDVEVNYRLQKEECDLWHHITNNGDILLLNCTVNAKREIGNADNAKGVDNICGLHFVKKTFELLNLVEICDQLFFITEYICIWGNYIV